MMSRKILFGSIEVRSGNKIHTVTRAVWIEGAEIYKPYKSPFKEKAFIALLRKDKKERNLKNP
jgi:hypothetical protein